MSLILLFPGGLVAPVAPAGGGYARPAVDIVALGGALDAIAADEQVAGCRADVSADAITDDERGTGCQVPPGAGRKGTIQ